MPGKPRRRRMSARRLGGWAVALCAGRGNRRGVVPGNCRCFCRVCFLGGSRRNHSGLHRRLDRRYSLYLRSDRSSNRSRLGHDNNWSGLNRSRCAGRDRRSHNSGDRNCRGRCRRDNSRRRRNHGHGWLYHYRCRRRSRSYRRTNHHGCAQRSPRDNRICRGTRSDGWGRRPNNDGRSLPGLRDDHARFRPGLRRRGSCNRHDRRRGTSDSDGNSRRCGGRPVAGLTYPRVFFLFGQNGLHHIAGLGDMREIDLWRESLRGTSPHTAPAGAGP